GRRNPGRPSDPGGRWSSGPLPSVASAIPRTLLAAAIDAALPVRLGDLQDGLGLGRTCAVVIDGGARIGRGPRGRQRGRPTGLYPSGPQRTNPFESLSRDRPTVLAGSGPCTGGMPYSLGLFP